MNSVRYDRGRSELWRRQMVLPASAPSTVGRPLPTACKHSTLSGHDACFESHVMRRPGPACVCLLVLIGCSASPPGPGGGDDDDMQVDAAPQPQTDAPPDDVVEPLVLGPLPDSTYWDIVPRHGTGPKNGTILLETDVAGAMTRPTASDGSFCVDIPLRKNATNMIQIRAVDAAGNLSEELTRSVRQQGSPPPPPMGD